MAEIEVEECNGSFRVTVDGTTTHVVDVPDDYVDRIGLTGVDRLRLVHTSFEFLLEREPKESIMRSYVGEFSRALPARTL